MATRSIGTTRQASWREFDRLREAESRARLRVLVQKSLRPRQRVILRMGRIPRVKWQQLGAMIAVLSVIAIYVQTVLTLASAAP
jgi:hypothetical protein